MTRRTHTIIVDGQEIHTDAEFWLQSTRRTYEWRWTDMLRYVEYAITHDYADDPEAQAFEIENLRYRLDSAREWLDSIEEDINRQDKRLRHENKIRQLREGTAGRTEAEIATARRLADRLEAKEES